jgi:hypothetical protein
MTFLIKKEEGYEWDWNKIHAALDCVPDDKFLDVTTKLLESQRENHAIAMSVINPLVEMTNIVLKQREIYNESKNKGNLC